MFVFTSAGVVTKMAVSLDDKLLGEKAHYYCSSSEDEDDRNEEEEEEGEEPKQSKAEAPEAEPPSLGPYSGTCTNVKELIYFILLT